MTKVLAVTTSMGTKWEAYSQTMLKTVIPEWERVIVDGRKVWSPTLFIKHIIHKDVDYVFHVDEDCFVESRDALRDLVLFLNENPQVVAAGIPDGGHYYRDHNPAALNLFFVIFRMDALRKAWNEKNRWSEIEFREEFKENVLKQCSDLDKSRIQWDEAEPYYPLFWSLLNAGGKFLYLEHSLHPKRWSTQIRMPSGEILAEHLWYLRQWFSDDIMTGHDCSNRTRFELFRRDLLRSKGKTIWFKMVLASMHTKRLVRRIYD